MWCLMNVTPTITKQQKLGGKCNKLADEIYQRKQFITDGNDNLVFYFLLYKAMIVFSP